MKSLKPFLFNLLVAAAIAAAAGCGDDDDDGAAGSGAAGAGNADSGLDSGTADSGGGQAGAAGNTSSEDDGGGADLLEIAGSYVDNFQGTHVISDDNWSMGGMGEFEITQFDNEENYAIAHNSEDNEYNPGLWSRMDWTQKDGELWFCQTAYDAASEEAALATQPADPADPANSGCQGFSWTELTPE
jgi:hypothetical protein